MDPVKIEASLRARGVPASEILRILALLPKAKAKKDPAPAIQLTPAEQAIVRQQKEDDDRAPEFKQRLVAEYHRKANVAGKVNPLLRCREIEEISKDSQVRGPSRFEGQPLFRRA